MRLALKSWWMKTLNLLCRMRWGLTGRYIGKARFMADIIGTVFGCVNPEDIVFAKCRNHVPEGDKVVAIAQNEGIASRQKLQSSLRILQQSGMEKLPN